MNIVFTHSHWLIYAVVALALFAGLLIYSYRGKTNMSIRLRWLAGLLKLSGCAMLFFFLLGPKIQRTYTPDRENHWVVLIDNSASMTLKDQDNGASRADQLKTIVNAKPQEWEQDLSKEFLLDYFTFDSQLRLMNADKTLNFEGAGSAMGSALSAIKERYKNQPLAGVLMITDGSPTDSLENITDLPPVFPLVIQPQKTLKDLSIISATAQETLFEDAPIIVDISTSALGLQNSNYKISLMETGGKVLEEKTIAVGTNHYQKTVRFQVRPKKQGTVFLEAKIEALDLPELREATLENNTKYIATNRDAGPYRVLYIAGRPNFEHKFLQRALEDDASVRLTSLIRIAGREPKFDYLSRSGEQTNPLFRGFEEQEEAERFDEAVFIRLNTKFPGELAAGFPKTAKELFPFEAVIIDDVEAEFFTRQQMRLLQRYVTERGGSVIMLGGAGSLDAGGYDGTVIGDLLPVYLQSEESHLAPTSGKFKLTREGMLEPWARLHMTEREENQRIDNMPTFANIHTLAGIRPGAMSVAVLESETGKEFPALITSRHGRGRTSLLALTDLWRWGMKDKESREKMNTTWRQLVRWLLADVPKPLSLEITDSKGKTKISTKLLGEDFKAVESGNVKIEVIKPEGAPVNLSPNPHPSKVGVQEADYRASIAGGHIIKASIIDPKTGIQTRTQSGWVHNTQQNEYISLLPDMPAMQQLAESTGGKMISLDNLDNFVSELESIELPIQETRLEPLTNNALWLVFALLCFIGEWALRRWKKLA